MAYVTAPRRLAGLGSLDFSVDWKVTGYTGLNRAGDVISNAMLDSGGSADSSALATYASAAAGKGAAAGCIAVGAGAVAPGCAAVGSAMAKILIGMFGKSEPSQAYTFTDRWNDYIVPYSKAAQIGIFAIRGYLTMRDARVDEAAEIVGGDRFAALKWASDWLKARGCPPAPIDARWDPSNYASRWEAYKKMGSWAASQAPATTPPFQTPQTVFNWHNLNPNQPTNLFVKDYVTLAQKVGLQSDAVITLSFYPTGLPSPPGAPIDFGLVGAFQAVNTAAPRLSKGGPIHPCATEGLYCDVPINLLNSQPIKDFFGRTRPKGSFLVGTVANAKALDRLAGVGPLGIDPVTRLQFQPVIKADIIPSKLAFDLNVMLQELRPQLIKAAHDKRTYKAPSPIKPIVVRRPGMSPEQTGALLLLGGAAASAFLIWKRRRQ